MSEILSMDVFVVEEHVGLFKAANNFDIYDPQTGQIVIECREEQLGFFTKLLRFTDYKRFTPFHIELRTPDGETIVEVKRGTTFLRSNVEVIDPSGQLLGRFRQKLLTIGGAFKLLSPDDEPLCELKGKWTGWNFKFTREGVVYAEVSKKWSGIGKEMFTSADNYVLSISKEVPPESPLRQLILAAVMSIDLVLKE